MGEYPWEIATCVNAFGKVPNILSTSLTLMNLNYSKRHEG